MTREQIKHIEIIKYAFKRDEKRDLNDSDAVTFALELTAAMVVNQYPEQGFMSEPLAGSKSVLN